MNIDSFYNELNDELEVFRLETKVSDEIIADLFQAYSEGKYTLEELIELIEEFIFKLRRFDLEDDEIIEVLQQYFSMYDSLVYDDEAVEELDLIDDIVTDEGQRMQDLENEMIGDYIGEKGPEADYTQDSDAEDAGVLLPDDEGYIDFDDFVDMFST